MSDQNIKSKNAPEEDHGKAFLAWDFPEYTNYDRGPIWYVFFFLITIGLIVYSFYTANFLFAVLIILFGFIIFVSKKQPPINMEFKIFKDGVMIGTRFYEWPEIKNFHIIYRSEKAKILYLDLRSTLSPDFSIPIEKQNPLRIRQILKNYLEEDLSRSEEKLSDKINHWLKI